MIIGDSMLKQNKNDIISIAKVVSKKLDKTLFSIVLDILSCYKKYQINYNEYLNMEVYLMNSKQREGFISDEINKGFVSKYNDINFKYIFEDRIEFNRIFKNFINRDYIVIDEKSYIKFVDFLIGKSKIVAKPIKKDLQEKIKVFRIDAKTDRKKLFNLLLKKKLVLIEEFIRQNNTLNKVCETCVNSLQVTTFIDEDNNVIILNRIFKIGINNLLNSLNNGGLYTLLDKNGKVLYPAISKDDKLYKIHPKSKVNLEDYIFKDLKKVEEFIRYIAKELKEVRYITWDVTLTNNGPCLIGADWIPRVFNIKPSCNKDFIGFKQLYKKEMKMGDKYERTSK